MVHILQHNDHYCEAKFCDFSSKPLIMTEASTLFTSSMALLSVLCSLSPFIPTKTSKSDSTVILILHRRKLRLRSPKNFAHVHTASKQQSPSSNRSLSGSKSHCTFLLLHITSLNGYKRRSFLYSNSRENKQLELVDLLKSLPPLKKKKIYGSVERRGKKEM